MPDSVSAEDIPHRVLDVIARTHAWGMGFPVGYVCEEDRRLATARRRSGRAR